MNTHIPNEKQEKAFKKVVSAIKAAKKIGLNFYGKQFELVAYVDAANDYQNIDFYKCIEGKGSQIPCLISYGPLSDSGADDYARYLTLKDEEKFNSECDCEDFENGLVSNYCEVHNENPYNNLDN